MASLRPLLKKSLQLIEKRSLTRCVCVCFFLKLLFAALTRCFLGEGRGFQLAAGPPKVWAIIGWDWRPLEAGFVLVPHEDRRISSCTLALFAAAAASACKLICSSAALSFMPSLASVFSSQFTAGAVTSWLTDSLCEWVMWSYTDYYWYQVSADNQY